MIALYALVFTGGFTITAAGIWALCSLAPYLGLVDAPEGRKTHTRSTPVVGGLAILLGTTLAMLAATVLKDHTAALVSVALQHLGYFVGAALLIIIGAVDDRKPIPARYKLVIQLAACAIAVIADHTVVGDVDVNFGSFKLSLGPMVIPFTILVMVTITNAINMIDGIDGLAGGVTFVGFLIMAKALMTAGFPTAPYVIALLSAVAAFLVFNFPLLTNRPAKVFLGDSGSLICGFTLADLAIDLSSMPNRVFKPSTALWFLFIPVADTTWLYIRRTWVARAPYAAGRDHIHHLLMERYSARAVAWILVIASGLMAGGAYLAERRHVLSVVMIGLWILAFLVYGALTWRPWARAWKNGPVHREIMARKAASDA